MPFDKRRSFDNFCLTTAQIKKKCAMRLSNENLFDNAV